MPVAAPIRTSVPRLTVVDERTRRRLTIDGRKFGEFLRYVREDTPSEHEPEKPLGRAELAARINAEIRRRSLAERPISAAIIQRLEDGVNVFGGHFVRIQQVMRELDLRVAIESARNRKLRYAL